MMAQVTEWGRGLVRCVVLGQCGAWIVSAGSTLLTVRCRLRRRTGHRRTPHPLRHGLLSSGCPAQHHPALSRYLETMQVPETMVWRGHSPKRSLPYYSPGHLRFQPKLNGKPSVRSQNNHTFNNAFFVFIQCELLFLQWPIPLCGFL